jgi:uncharacterized membrane protein
MTRRSPLALVVLALGGCAISGYLAAYQLGVIDTAWDPFFGAGSAQVLTSGISRALPVPDAVLGTVAYGVDAALALLLHVGLGPAARIATLLAILAVVGAATGIALAISQPLLVRAWCSLCLASSALAVGLAGAAVQHARRYWQATA